MNRIANDSSFTLRNNEYADLFRELLTLKPGQEVFGPLPLEPRPSGGVLSGIASIILPKAEQEAVPPKTRPIIKVMKWNDDLFEHYNKNLHSPEQMQKLQAVVRRIMNEEKVTLIAKELEKRHEDKELVNRELKRLNHLIQAIWEAPTLGSSSTSPRILPPSSKPIKIQFRSMHFCRPGTSLFTPSAGTFSDVSRLTKKSLADRVPNEVAPPSAPLSAPPSELRVKRVSSDPSLYQETKKDLPVQALSLENEKKLLGMNYQIRKDSLDEAREKHLAEQRAKEFVELLPRNFAKDWKVRILDFFISLKEPEEIKAVARVADKLQVIEIFQFALGNENIASKLLYFLGSLPFHVLQEALASYRPETREGLELLNRCLRLQPIRVIKVPDSQRIIIYSPHPGEEVHAVPVDITKEVHKWFIDVCFEDTRQKFCDFSNLQKVKIDDMAKLFRFTIKWPYLTEDHINMALDLKNSIKLYWQVAMNYKALVFGIVKDNKTLDDVDREYAIFLARFDRRDPRAIVAAEKLNRVALLEMMKQHDLLLKELHEKLSQKGTYDAECRSLLLSARELGTKIEESIKKADEGPGGGIFDVIEYDIYTNFICGPNGPMTLYGDDFKKDEAYYFLETLNVFQYDSLVEYGLLQNVPSNELANGKEQISKLFEHAKKNLIHLGIKNLEDLWERHIYNQFLLKSYLNKPEVKAVLQRYPLVFDPFKSLEKFGISTLDEYREIGLLTNVPENIYEKPIDLAYSSQLYTKIFRHAQQNLTLLGVENPISFLANGVKTKEQLKSFLSFPQCQEILKQNPFREEV